MPSVQHFQAMRDHFLKGAYPEEHARMEKSGELQAHLETVGSQAKEMWDDLITQMRLNPDLPESYPDRVKALEAMPEQVREMVNADLIHQPLRGKG